MEAFEKCLSPLIAHILVQWPEAFSRKLVRGVIVELRFKSEPECFGKS